MGSLSKENVMAEIKKPPVEAPTQASQLATNLGSLLNNFSQSLPEVANMIAQIGQKMAGGNVTHSSPSGISNAELSNCKAAETGQSTSSCTRTGGRG